MSNLHDCYNDNGDSSASRASRLLRQLRTGVRTNNTSAQHQQQKSQVPSLWYRILHRGRNPTNTPRVCAERAFDTAWNDRRWNEKQKRKNDDPFPDWKSNWQVEQAPLSNRGVRNAVAVADLSLSEAEEVDPAVGPSARHESHNPHDRDLLYEVAMEGAAKPHEQSSNDTAPTNWGKTDAAKENDDDHFLAFDRAIEQSLNLGTLERWPPGNTARSSHFAADVSTNHSAAADVDSCGPLDEESDIQDQELLESEEVVEVREDGSIHM